MPAGIDDGQRLRLTGRGPAAPRNGIAGDLYVTVRVRPHPSLERHGFDLVHQRRIAMTQAALGTVLTVDTLDEPEEVTVPPGTQPGHVFRFKGRGVPVLQGRGRGDLLVQIDVDVPQELTDAEQDLLTQFAELRGEEVAAPRGGWLLLEDPLDVRRAVTEGFAAAAPAVAHVFVDDVAAMTATSGSKATTGTTCSACAGSGRASRSPRATGVVAGGSARSPRWARVGSGSRRPVRSPPNPR